MASDPIVKRFLVVALLFLWVVPATAQRILLEGVSVTSGTMEGLVALPPHADFINATRAPELFRTTGREDAVADGTTAHSHLAIDFDFSFRGRPRHAFSLGFARKTLDATLYALPAADSLASGVDLTSTNEYFNLRAGYRYRLWPKGKFSVFAGLAIEAGTPVSALSKEIFGADSLGHENAFFARRSGMMAVSLPIGLRLKLTRAMHLKFSINPSRFWTGLDGIRVAATLVGTEFGLLFRFRRRDG